MKTKENVKGADAKETKTTATIMKREEREKAFASIFAEYAKSNGLKCEYIDKDGGLFRIATDMNNGPKNRIDVKVTSKNVTVWAGLEMNVTGLENGVNGSHISNKEKRYSLTFESAEKLFTVTEKTEKETEKAAATEKGSKRKPTTEKAVKTAEKAI